MPNSVASPIPQHWKITTRKSGSALTGLRNHSHKKGKDSLETRAVFSWILILTWNFGGGRSASASTLASTSWFWCYQNYNWLFYMLHNDIISTSASEAVEKIPADEKDYRKCSFIAYFAQPQELPKSRPTYRQQYINSCLPTRIYSV